MSGSSPPPIKTIIPVIHESGLPLFIIHARTERPGCYEILYTGDMKTVGGMTNAAMFRCQYTAVSDVINLRPLRSLEYNELLPDKKITRDEL